GGKHLQLFLRSGNTGDIDKGQKNAIDHIAGGVIGQDAGEEVALAVGKAHRTLDHLAAEHRADVVLEIRVGEPTDEVGQRSAVVAGNEVEQLGDRRREAADHEISVEKNSRDLGTFKEVVQIAVGAIKLLDLVGELTVYGLQFFVDRLQF